MDSVLVGRFLIFLGVVTVWSCTPVYAATVNCDGLISPQANTQTLTEEEFLEKYLPGFHFSQRWELSVEATTDLMMHNNALDFMYIPQILKLSVTGNDASELKLPPAVRALTGKFGQPDMLGNCFNACQLWDRHKQVEITEEDTFTQYVGDPDNYTEVSSGPLQFGDKVSALAFDSQKGIWRHQHAVTYFDQDIVWHKPTPSPDHPWTYSSLSNAFRYLVLHSPEIRFRVYHSVSRATKK